MSFFEAVAHTSVKASCFVVLPLMLQHQRQIVYARQCVWVDPKFLNTAEALYGADTLLIGAFLSGRTLRITVQEPETDSGHHCMPALPTDRKNYLAATCLVIFLSHAVHCCPELREPASHSLLTVSSQPS